MMLTPAQSGARRNVVPNYFVVDNLLTHAEIPKNGSVSTTIHHDERVKVSLLGFSGGQELNKNTLATPAFLEILEGKARVTLDGEVKELTRGAWIYIEANVPHSVYAQTETVMLLTMLLNKDTRR
jgi:quercetin dioxygenase-like cupin family protein